MSIDNDCVLDSLVTRSGSFIVSWDPAVTVANTLTAPTNGQLRNVIALFSAGTSVGILQGLKIPLSAGEVIYLCATSANTVLMLYFID